MAMNNRLLRPLARFNPLSIAGLDLWFDAADRSTVTEAGGDGTGVSEWRNKSALSGRNMTQAIANNRPLYEAAYLAGKHSVVFDGDNDILSCTSVTLTHPFDFFAVMRHNSAYISVKRWSVSPALSQGISGGRLSETNLFMVNGTPFGSAQGNPVVHPETFSVIEFSIDGAGSVGRCNGEAFTTLAGTIGTGNPGGLSFGGGVGTFSEIAVAECLVFSRTLTSSEQNMVTQYLRSKWGV
jgi:hypothetical protein